MLLFIQNYHDITFSLRERDRVITVCWFKAFQGNFWGCLCLWWKAIIFLLSYAVTMKSREKHFMTLLLYSNSVWSKAGPSYESHPAPNIPSQRREVSQCLGLGKGWEQGIWDRVWEEESWGTEVEKRKCYFLLEQILNWSISIKQY